MREVLLLILFSLSVCIHTYAAPRRAIISFVNKDSVYDFGRIAKGNKARDQFEIKNTGDATLIITNVKSETSNFKFEWPKKPLKPRKKALIYVTCTPIEQTDIGSFNTAVFITSNATQQPYPFIHISGAVIPAEGAPVPIQKQSQDRVELRMTPEEIAPTTR